MKKLSGESTTVAGRKLLSIQHLFANSCLREYAQRAKEDGMIAKDI